MKWRIIIIIFIIPLANFSHQCYMIVFHWNLSDCKSSLASRAHLGILADLNNAVVWMVSARPPVFISSRPFYKSLGTISSVPTIIVITTTLRFFSFLSSLARSKYLCCITVIQLYVYIYIRKQYDERIHLFRKIYLSHFIRKGCERVIFVAASHQTGLDTRSMFGKGLCMRGELETEQTATYWPFGSSSFSGCWAAQRGSWEPKPSAGSWSSLLRTATRTPTNWLQLTRTVCGTRLYNCLSSTYFPWASQLHRIQPIHGEGYILISSTGCTFFLIDGGVEGQYVTLVSFFAYFDFHCVCWNDKIHLTASSVCFC